MPAESDPRSAICVYERSRESRKTVKIGQKNPKVAVAW